LKPYPYQLFESEGDAKLHEIELLFGLMFDEFAMLYAATNKPKSVLPPAMRRIIMDWEHFKSGAQASAAPKGGEGDADQRRKEVRALQAAIRSLEDGGWTPDRDIAINALRQLIERSKAGSSSAPSL
jgi:hypothetical protein